MKDLRKTPRASQGSSEGHWAGLVMIVGLGQFLWNVESVNTLSWSLGTTGNTRGIIFCHLFLYEEGSMV